jgi:excisionase family DNA binding protein
MAANSFSSDAVLCAKEAASLLRVSTWYVYELAKAGELPCIRLGTRAIRFRRQTIEEWLARCEKSQRRR